MKLRPDGFPELGETMTFVEVLKFVGERGWDDLSDYLCLCGNPGSLFKSDGATCCPDMLVSNDLHLVDIYPFAFKHDIWYWAGVPGDEVARFRADCEFAVSVAEITGNANLAITMLNALHVAGSEELETSWSWGFGRQRNEK